jgi:hypothetical protein
MSRRRPKNAKPVGGGGARHPNSLANLLPAPPAPPEGNQRRMTHGGYAAVDPARLDAKVQSVFDALAVDAPLRDHDGGLPVADRYVVGLLAECLCRLDDVRAHIRDFGMFDQETKQPRAVVAIEGKLRREAADYLDALGMTPRSRARLGLDLSRTMQAATIAEQIADAGAETAIEGEAS